MPVEPRTPPPPTRRRNRRQTLHHLRHQQRSPAYPHGRSMHQLPPQMETQTRPRIPQTGQRLPTPMATGAPRRIPGNETPLRTQETSEGTSMSVKTYTDTTRIIKTIEEHVWEIHCDAIGCNRPPTRLARRQQRHTTKPPLLPHTQRKPIKQPEKTTNHKKQPQETTPALAG